MYETNAAASKVISNTRAPIGIVALGEWRDGKLADGGCQELFAFTVSEDVPAYFSVLVANWSSADEECWEVRGVRDESGQQWSKAAFCERYGADEWARLEREIGRAVRIGDDSRDDH